MYQIYQTDGWVLGGVEVSEASRFLDIFTGEFGLVRGLAQGVRKLNSKLRYGLQDYSYGKISLVKGKLFWRVVGIEKSDDFNWLREDKEVFQLICRIFSLLKRMVKGEEKDRVIFDEINSAFRFIGANKLSKNELLGSEVILVFRILQKLGYVGRDDQLNYLADFSEWRRDTLKIDSQTKTLALKQINSSLAHSHL